MRKNLGIRGINLIKSYEKLELRAYMPTKKDKPTIGWGHTRGVKMGDVCTTEQAEEWFRQDTERAVTLVNGLISDTLYSPTQSQFDALVSLVFNIEISIKKGNSIRRYIEKGDIFAACGAIYLWRKQAGEDLLGLARRRVKEMDLFLEDRF